MEPVKAIPAQTELQEKLHLPKMPYSSPYSRPAPVPIPQQQSLKRSHFEVAKNVQENDEKRRRVEVNPTPAIPDFDAILSNATVAAVASVNTTSQNTSDESKPKRKYMKDPQIYMRWSSCPLLENLSNQILSLMMHGPYNDTIGIFTSPQSDRGQQYQTLRSLLDQTKKMYIPVCPDSNFLHLDEAYAGVEKYRDVIWSTNFAILVAAIFGGNECDWSTLQDKFLEILVPRVDDLNNEACELYLTLGSQMIMTSLAAEEQHQTRTEIFDDYLPRDLEERLRSRHSDYELTNVEIELIQKSELKRKMLDERRSDLESLASLMQEYSWDEFLTSFFEYIKKTYSDKIPVYKAAAAPPPSQINTPHEHSFPDQGDLPFDMDALVNSAASSALQAAASPSSHHAQQASLYGEQYASGTPVIASQSKPTATLYEEARQQAASKNSTNNRRGSGGLSARRPWSHEEEHALMAGLDCVKGPHWSQILQLYGTQGTVSHILEHRNQVQLKDKARNLKLFFLKSGIEVPYYLSCVTGELKTRAPSQAARKEAEERARINDPEEVSRMTGIMTLANGFQLPVSHHGLPLSESKSHKQSNVTGTHSPANSGLNSATVEDILAAELPGVASGPTSAAL